jgi:hypothetical protein
MAAEIKRVTKEAVRKEVVMHSGIVDQFAPIDSAEVLGALLRSAASILCPSPTKALVAAAETALRGLVDSTDLAQIRDTLRHMVDELIGYGDLVENEKMGLREARTGTLLLFLGPLRYVKLNSREAFLLGVEADNADSLDAELSERLVLEGHRRRITFGNNVKDIKDTVYDHLVVSALQLVLYHVSQGVKRRAHFFGSI